MQVALSSANRGALKATSMLICDYSAVSILSMVLAERPENDVRIMLGDSFLFRFQKGCEVHPRSYGRVPVGLVPRGCSDREVKFDHSPPSGAEVRNARGYHSTTRLHAAELREVEKQHYLFVFVQLV